MFVKREALSEEQAIVNHSQDLDTLQRRGSMCPQEIYWNVKGLKILTHTKEEDVIACIKEIAYT